MSRSDDLRAQLALVELEESLAVAKADRKTTPATLRAMKQEVRAARQAYRDDVRDGPQED